MNDLVTTTAPLNFHCVIGHWENTTKYSYKFIMRIISLFRHRHAYISPMTISYDFQSMAEGQFGVFLDLNQHYYTQNKEKKI